MTSMFKISDGSLMASPFQTILKTEEGESDNESKISTIQFYTPENSPNDREMTQFNALDLIQPQDEIDQVLNYDGPIETDFTGIDEDDRGNEEMITLTEYASPAPSENEHEQRDREIIRHVSQIGQVKPEDQNNWEQYLQPHEDFAPANVSFTFRDF